MIRIYHPYWKWEDYQHGLYQNIEEAYTEKQLEEGSLAAKNLLCNSELFKETALKVVSEWKHSAEENLTNTSRNRQAWIGQASCCYLLGVPEFVTKYGWRMMSPEQQTEANRVADEVINYWEIRHKGMNHAKKISEY